MLSVQFATTLRAARYKMKPYAKEEEDDLQRRRYQVVLIEKIDEEVQRDELLIVDL